MKKDLKALNGRIVLKTNDSLARKKNLTYDIVCKLYKFSVITAKRKAVF